MDKTNLLKEWEKSCIKRHGHYIYAIIEQSKYDRSIDIHTHGLRDLGLKELQIVINMNPNKAQNIITNIANDLINEKMIISDDTNKNIFYHYLENNIQLSTRRMLKLDNINKDAIEWVYRIIFPDSNNIFPYKNSAIYINQFLTILTIKK